MNPTFWESGILGTARRPFDPSVLPPEVAAIVPSSDVASEESRFLAAAAAVSIRARAGKKAIGDAVTIDEAPGEEARECSPTLAGIVERLIDENGSGLLGIAAIKMAAAGQRLPHALLPKALAIVDPSRREFIRPILGHRGAWLARRIHPEHWAIAALSPAALTDDVTAETAWNEGSPRERHDVLREMRRRDPEAARERLAVGFKSEKADLRESFVEILAIGLSEKDEPFLNGALKDRATGVRAAAARLLVRLPDSALARRRRAAAEGILGVKKGLLSTTVTVTMPETFDPAWAADGLVEKPPAHLKIGPRAFWTRQILGSVPPRFFCDKFGIKPADLITAVLKADFPDIVEAFADATTIFFDPDFYDALVDHGVALLAKGRVSVHESSLPTLIVSAPIEIADRKLVDISRRPVEPRILLGLLAYHIVEWSEDLTLRFLEVAQNVNSVDHSFNTEYLTVAAAAIRIPDSTLERALEGWTPLLLAKDLPAFAERGIEEFLNYVRMRRVIVEETRI